MLNIQIIVPALIGALAVIAGWPIAHWLSRKRDISAEKRKLRVGYLLEAYRMLERAGNRPLHPDSEHNSSIENAIADIQLLGTPHQIELAKEFIEKFAGEGSATFDPLLLDLRHSLRRELELESTSAPLLHFRIMWDGKDKK